MLIKRRSNFTGKIHILDIPCTDEQLLRWNQGELIQVAIPNLTDDQREFILNGTTPEEWDEIMGDEL